MIHGVTHDVANCVQHFVITVVPHLHSTQCNLAESPGVRMDTACQVLCKARQECFRWANEVANGVVGTAPVNFNEILGKAQTCQVSSSCPLPSLWCAMVDVRVPTRPGTSVAPRANQTISSPGSGQSCNVTAPAFNAHANCGLLQCFQDSSHSTISSMMSGQSLDIIPKHNGNPVCLTWALKGECAHTSKQLTTTTTKSTSTSGIVNETKQKEAPTTTAELSR